MIRPRFAGASGLHGYSTRIGSAPTSVAPASTRPRDDRRATFVPGCAPRPSAPPSPRRGHAGIGVDDVGGPALAAFVRRLRAVLRGR